MGKHPKKENHHEEYQMSSADRQAPQATQYSLALCPWEIHLLGESLDKKINGTSLCLIFSWCSMGYTNLCLYNNQMKWEHSASITDYEGSKSVMGITACVLCRLNPCRHRDDFHIATIVLYHCYDYIHNRGFSWVIIVNHHPCRLTVVYIS